jgi:hypothetical protein
VIFRAKEENDVMPELWGGDHPLKALGSVAYYLANRAIILTNDSQCGDNELDFHPCQKDVLAAMQLATEHFWVQTKLMGPVLLGIAICTQESLYAVATCSNIHTYFTSPTERTASISNC